MTIGIIGTGNLAHFLVVRAREVQMQIAYLMARNSVVISDFLTPVPILKWDNDITALPKVDLLFLAVNDDALSELNLINVPDQTILVHFAGTRSIEVLKQYSTHFGVAWPIYSISKFNSYQGINIPFAIEGSDAQTTLQLKRFCDAMQCSSYELNHQDRLNAHLNAVIVNNFTNHLLGIAQQLAMEHHLDFNMMIPIIKQTISNTQTHKHLFEIQTGPAARGDEQTIEAHLSLLNDHPAYKQIYQSITHSIKEIKNKS